MSFQPYQLIFLATYTGLILIFWKVNNTKIRILIGVLAFVLFFINPVRFKQEGNVKTERSVTRFEKVPDKVEVNKENFQTKQETELNKLKKQSEELKDEIHD